MLAKHREQYYFATANWGEEERVTTGSETKTAKANKESINKDHNGTPYKTISPTSTTPSN